MKNQRIIVAFKAPYFGAVGSLENPQNTGDVIETIRRADGKGYTVADLERDTDTKQLVKMNYLAALLAGLYSLRLLSFGAGDDFIADGECEISQADLVRLATHGWRDQFNAEFFGLLYVVVTAVQGISKQLLWR